MIGAGGHGEVAPGALLVVEPSPPVQERLLALAAEAQAHAPVVAVATAVEALRLLEAMAFEAVIVDADGAGGAGVALAEVVRRRWPASAVVVLTTAVEEELLLRCRRAGVREVLPKGGTARLVEVLRGLSGPARGAS